MNKTMPYIREEQMSVSPLPLYTQIKDVLRERILDGTYPAHSKLPSESELISAFGVSRITVRQALRDLQKEGLTFSIQGKGTFVTKPKAVQELTRLQGFGEAMARKGYETYSKLVGTKEGSADKEVAQALDLPQGAPVVQIERIRYLNRSPVSLDVSFFPADVGRLFCFSRLEGMTPPTTITHVWHYNEHEMARVELPVAASSWRTWSSKKILPAWQGEWLVQVLDADGNELDSVSFTVGAE